MIRFAGDAPGGGRVLGMGLSFANLRELRADRPIVFELAPFGSTGQLVLACGNERTLEALLAKLPGAHVVGLTPRTLATLEAGGLVEVPLRELGVPALALGLLFAGPTEYELVESLRRTGVLARDAALVGFDEYERHERNAVADCELCRARKHGLPGARVVQKPARQLGADGWIVVAIAVALLLFVVFALR